MYSIRIFFAAALLMLASACTVAPVVEQAEQAKADATQAQIESILAKLRLDDIQLQIDKDRSGDDRSETWSDLLHARQRYERLDATARAAAYKAEQLTQTARGQLLAQLGGPHGISPDLRGPPVSQADVRLFFGTDRRLDSAAASPTYRFSGLRGSEKTVLGTVTVSIPAVHRFGKVEKPALWYLSTPDPEKHMIMNEPRVLDGASFARELQDQRNRGNKQVLLFVHGYNVSFEDAALRTAQMATDLGLDAMPSFFSWPSVGAVKDYLTDEGNAMWAVPHFKSFLSMLLRAVPDGEIVLVSHSMGARLTTTALKEFLTEAPRLRNRIKEVVLAAPDIDADVFVSQILPVFIAARQSVTLYASDKDKALRASRAASGYPRAGEAGQNIVVRPGMDTVDASAIDTDFLAHSYFAQSRPLLTDLAMLLKDGLRPDRRPGLREIDTAGGIKYWRLRD